MYLVKATFSGGVGYFRSTEEPRWVKEKSSGKVRLKFSLPEDGIYERWQDRPQTSIYKEDLSYISWREELADTREFTAEQRARMTQERQEFNFLTWLIEEGESPPNYTEVRGHLGWGQKKCAEFLIDLNERELIHRRKEGRSSYFSVTDEGRKRRRYLFEEYDQGDNGD